MEIFNKSFFKFAFGFIAIIILSVLLIGAVKMAKEQRDGHATQSENVELCTHCLS